MRIVQIIYLFIAFFFGGNMATTNKEQLATQVQKYEILYDKSHRHQRRIG